MSIDYRFASRFALFFDLLTLLAPGPTAIAQERWQSPPIESVISVRDGHSGEVVAVNDWIDSLAEADVVFLGETHNDETTHRVEWFVYEQLLRRRDNRVVMAMEMFERDVQPTLDDYLAGTIDESEFLAAARPWGNYHEAYRPLVEAAKAVGAPVVASNFPRPLRMQMSGGDPQKVLSELGENRHWAPAEFFPNSDLYGKRTDNAVRGHLAMMRAMEGDRLYSTQSLWDNSMGESCALALDKYLGYQVVHVNGGFHTAYWDGTALQLRKRKPDAKIKTVSIVPAASPASEQLRGAPVADYVVFAESRATNEDEDRWSVYVPRETRYRVHIPRSASSVSPAPLLIWLCDDGLTAREGIDFCRAAWGDDVAVLALEPTHRERLPDLSVGGRWFWPEDFSADIAASVEAIERTWGYALRHFPIDPNRVCLAGEGTGGTVVAAATLLTDRMSLRGVAIEPKQFSKLKDFPLPLLEDWGNDTPPSRTLTVAGNAADASWWKEELEQYATVDVTSTWQSLAEEPWPRQATSRELVAAALQVDSPKTPEGRTQKLILVQSNAPLDLHWSRLAALRASDDEVDCAAARSANDSAATIPLAVAASDFANGAELPLCPGPFGGTTVIVVPAGSDDWEQWLALEKQDPVQARSRFHRLRVCTDDESDTGLVAKLSELNQQNRNNVLIIPARFYADYTVMMRLESLAQPFADRMTLHWLPGLGGGSR